LVEVNQLIVANLHIVIVWQVCCPMIWIQLLLEFIFNMFKLMMLGFEHFHFYES